MTAELRIPEQQRVLIQHEMESISDPLVLQIIEESRIGAIDLVSDAAICHLSSIRNINIHTLEPTSLDTASLPNTNRTKDSYQTAAEYTSEVLFTGMGAVSDAADHLPSQNQRVMRELLKQAGPTDSLFKTRVIDSSQVGQLLQSFRLDVRNEKLWEHLRVLELPPLPERLNDDLARRLRSEVKNAEIQVNPDHENKTPSTIQQKHTLPWMTFQSIANQLHLFLGSIEGPHSTPYAGGLFHFLIYVGPNYPFKPPKFLAVTRIYHPNISPTGEICLDLFNDCVWGPAFSIQTALVGIASVLDDAGLDDPLVPEVAEIYLRDRSTYDENVRLYTQQYATPEYLFTDEGLDRCLQMCLRITGKD
jgi:ubiquitin-conjugating enzyme E2 D/E